jgi:hypothetical protein
MNSRAGGNPSLPMSRRLLWGCVLIGSALSLAAAWAIVTQQLVIGSREGGWVYRYLGRFNSHSIEPFVIASVLVAAATAAWWPRLRGLADDVPAEQTGKSNSVAEWAPIIAWCLLAVVIQALIRSSNPFPLGTMFASDNASSFYSVALKYDVRAILGDFERLRPTWALHAQSNLPGKLLLVRALIHVSTRPDVLAWLIVLLSNLGGVFVYIFARELFADRFIAGLAVVLYLFTPAKLYFFPLLNTVTPAIVFACACLMVRWLGSGRAAYAALLGAAIYGLILFEPTALVTGVLFAALLARAVVNGSITPGTAVRHIAVGIVAFAATHAVMRAWFGFDLISAFRHVSADATNFNVRARRPYGIWARQNLLDFSFGVGLCQVVLFAAAFGDGIARARSRSQSAVSIVLFCAAAAAMVGVADAVGINRGEVVRLWIFLACFWQIPAAYVCRRLDSRTAFTIVLIITVLQDALGSSMLGFIEP